MKGPMLLGADLGGTNCRVGLVDASGNLVELVHFPTHIDRGLLPLVDRIVSATLELRDLAQQRGHEVEGLGIGVPGLIAPDGTVTASPNLPALNQAPLGQILRRRLEMSVTMANDANAHAWGEGIFGAARSMRSFLCVTLGTGVGGGLVLDRKIWSGATGMAGEVGHIKVAAQERLCCCGATGCLETYCGASGLLKTARSLIDDGIIPGPVLKGEVLSVPLLVEAALHGDPVALEVFSLSGGLMGSVLAHVVNLLDIEGVVFTGGVAPVLDFMREEMLRSFGAEAFGHAGLEFPLLQGKLGPDAGIIGAAHLGTYG